MATATQQSHSQQFEAKGQKLSQSPQRPNLYLDKKPLPLPEGHRHDDDEVFTHEFTRNDVRGLIHSITQELKIKGVKTPLVLLAFRPKTNDHKLTEFLAQVIPNGTLPAKQQVIDKIVKNTDEFTLVAALKYIWARLPMNAIIGWDSYDAFKKLESRDNYPKKAFLEFMPQCLTSPSHASIVYDFLDLIVSFAANSKDNQLSGRKIAKMAGIWAFHGPQDDLTMTKSRLDPTENTFFDGLRDWLPAADAMFHLFLSFLRSMLPDDHNTKLQLPRTLQALLASNSYPPPDMTYSSTTLVSVPLVTIKTNTMSASPVEMLNKVPKVLKFDNPDEFEAKEDFALLKSLCRSDDNILNKLSSESRRIVEAMCQKPKDTSLIPGWPEYSTSRSSTREPQTTVSVSRVSLDDYFIWTWLASMSFEETVTKKKLFGRALISEVVFDGFKKWIIVEEQNTHANVRNHQPPLPEKPKVKKTMQHNYKSMLDDIPADVPSKPKKTRAKKEKPLPTVQPTSQNTPPRQRSDSTSSKKLGFFNPLKKLQHHNEPLPAPLPQARAPVVRESVYQQPEQIEPLPEIETNQYRLSIPLDSFGFDTDLGEQQDYSYDQDQYQSLAPQSNGYDNYNNGYSNGYQSYDPIQQQQNQYQQPQQSEEDYNYWSSEPRRSLAPPQTNRNSTYEIQQVVSSMEAPQPTYNEPGYRGSIDNLSSMVDQMTVQVGQVENKLGNKPGPMYDVEVPLRQDHYAGQHQSQPQYELPPDQYQEPDQQTQEYEQRHEPAYEYQDEPPSEVPVPAPVAKDTKPLPSMLDVVEKPRRKPPTPVIEDELQSATGSSVYGPTPTAMNTPAFTPQEKQGETMSSNIPGSDYPSQGHVKREDVPQIQVPQPKRQSQEVQNGYQYQPRSMIDDLERYAERSRGVESEQYNDSANVEENHDQRYSRATTAHESFYSTETVQRGETPYTDASEMKSPQRDPSPDTVPTPTESVRHSVKYPESIIDSYQMSIASSPQKASQNSSPAKSNHQSLNAATIAAIRASVPLSTSDAHYIPEPDLTNVPMPAPLPKSPLAAKRGSFSPEKYADADISRGSIEPVPQLHPELNGSMDSLPTQASYVTSRESAYGEGQVSPRAQQETQQRPQRKAPAQSPVRGQSSMEPLQSNVAKEVQTQQQPQYQQQSQSQAPVPQTYQQHVPQKIPQPVVQQGYKQDVPQTQRQPRQVSPQRSQQSVALTPQRMPLQQQTPHYDSATSPVHQNVGGTGAYPAVTPSRQQNLAPPGSNQGQRRPSPSSSFDSRGGSPFRQQGFPRPGGAPSSAPQGMHPPFNQRPRNGSVSSLTVPHGGQRQASPMHAPYKSSSPARPGSAPGQGPQGHQQRRGRSPQHQGAPQGYPPQQGYHPPPQQSYPPQGYPQQQGHGYPPQGPPPQGYPPQGYPPQGYPPQGYPPQGYPPQGYPPQGWYPPPQGWYPPPQDYYPPGPGSISSKSTSKPSASDMALQTIPAGVGMNKLHHRPANKMDKKNMRNALTQGDFGI